MLNCPYCGTPLRITNKDKRLWCPNHGFIDEDEVKDQIKDKNSESQKDKPKREYIG